MNISGYVIEKQIGKGGMAMVYRATQESLGRPVALKVMNPLFSDDPEFSQRFLAEGRLLAAVQHSNIITIHDIGISDGFHYIAMEYVEGRDLSDRIAAGLSPAQATAYLETLTECLAIAHRQQIVHRDIKPANILFRKDGTLLLADFGIAKQLNTDSGLTATGAMVGTPNYLSPEQAQCQPIDGRADIYSLGVLYYEMLTGDRPFAGDSDVCVAIRHITEDVPELPAEFGDCGKIIECMMRKNPDDRFPSCDSLLVALSEYRETGNWSGDIANIPVSAPVNSKDHTIVSVAMETKNALPEKGTGQAPLATRIDHQSSCETIKLDELSVHDGRTVVQSGGPGDRREQAETSSEQDLNVGSASIATRGSPTQQRSPVMALVIGFFVLALTAGGFAMFRHMQAVVEPTIPLVVAPVPAIDLEAEKEAQQKEQRDRRAREFLIQSLMRDAESAIADYRLTTPASNSAYTFYKRILSIEPDHAGASKGIDNIADVYYRLARNAEQDWRYQKAMHLANAGLKIRPNHESLLILRGSLLAETGKPGRKVKSALKDVKNWFE